MALTFSIEPVKKCEIMQRRSVLITLSGVSPDIFLLKKNSGKFFADKRVNGQIILVRKYFRTDPDVGSSIKI